MGRVRQRIKNLIAVFVENVHLLPIDFEFTAITHWGTGLSLHGLP
jgi:hypothetical protein